MVLLATSMFGSSFAQNNFPLARQTWVFTNGPTEKTHIVKSISNFAASKVFVCQFSDYDSRDNLIVGSCRFASLEGLFLRSTAEALDSVYAQLRRNYIANQEIGRAYYNAFPDTVYNCDAQLRDIAARSNGRFTRFSLNGANVYPSSLQGEWLPDPPICYAARARTSNDDLDEMACENGWCASMYQTGFHEVCSTTEAECRSYIDEGNMSARPSSRFYWNLHIFPRVVLNPKHHATGRIMTEITLNEAQATALRNQAVANPANETLKPYLNPVLNDSASVIFSGQFLTPDNPQASFLSLDIPSTGQGGTSFTHDPKYAFRISGMPTDFEMDINSTSDAARALRAALLRPYAKSNADDRFLERLDANCQFWQLRDMDIGKRAFSIRPMSVTLPDALPSDPYDPAWKKQVREGNVTYNRDNRVIENQLAIVRNLEFRYSDYWWKGCPDREREPTGMTKKQMMDFIAHPVPVCNLKHVAAAYEKAYWPIFQTFTGDDDNYEAEQTYKRMMQAGQIANRYAARLNDFSYENCPVTPLSILVNR